MKMQHSTLGVMINLSNRCQMNKQMMTMKNWPPYSVISVLGRGWPALAKSYDKFNKQASISISIQEKNQMNKYVSEDDEELTSI